jgi:hypothetical protein
MAGTAGLSEIADKNQMTVSVPYIVREFKPGMYGAMPGVVGIGTGRLAECAARAAR